MARPMLDLLSWKSEGSRRNAWGPGLRTRNRSSPSRRSGLELRLRKAFVRYRWAVSCCWEKEIRKKEKVLQSRAAGGGPGGPACSPPCLLSMSLSVFFLSFLHSSLFS